MMHTHPHIYNDFSILVYFRSRERIGSFHPPSRRRHGRYESNRHRMRFPSHGGRYRPRLSVHLGRQGERRGGTRRYGGSSVHAQVVGEVEREEGRAVERLRVSYRMFDGSDGSVSGCLLIIICALQMSHSTVVLRRKFLDIPGERVNSVDWVTAQNVTVTLPVL